MSKAKSAFFCQNCGHETPKWLGKCPGCKEWNTFIEERTEKMPKHVVSFSKSSQAQQAVLIQEVQKSEESRILRRQSRGRAKQERVFQREIRVHESPIRGRSSGANRGGEQSRGSESRSVCRSGSNTSSGSKN